MNKKERKNFLLDLRIEIYRYLLEQGFEYKDSFDTAFEQAVSEGYTEKELFTTGLTRMKDKLPILK